MVFQSESSGGTGGFAFATGSTPTVKLAISGGGSVGIGTSFPAQKLDVNGAVQASGGAGFVLANSSNSYNGSGIVYNYISRSDGSGGSYPWNANGTMVFQSESNGGTSGFAFATGSTPSVKMTISGSGNIGIGTTSPSEKLSVDGNISANGFIRTKKLTVTQTGWSDYVFHDDYKLRSLSSLESFIKQNKHLPEVPSAKEVEEKGISIGDNQALLLKKIEELTLYLIEMKKENINQQKQIDKANKIIERLQFKLEGR